MWVSSMIDQTMTAPNPQKVESAIDWLLQSTRAGVQVDLGGPYNGCPFLFFSSRPLLPCFISSAISVLSQSSLLDPVEFKSSTARGDLSAQPPQR